jgi:hypothetical protein
MAGLPVRNSRACHADHERHLILRDPRLLSKVSPGLGIGKRPPRARLVEHLVDRVCFVHSLPTVTHA